MFSGKNLKVTALGPEDLLIMKFMAGRKKDMSHIRFLIKKKADLKIVDKRLDELLQGPFKEEAQKALELFDEVTEEFE